MKTWGPAGTKILFWKSSTAMDHPNSKTLSLVDVSEKKTYIDLN